MRSIGRVGSTVATLLLFVSACGSSSSDLPDAARSPTAPATSFNTAVPSTLSYVPTASASVPGSAGSGSSASGGPPDAGPSGTDPASSGPTHPGSQSEPAPSPELEPTGDEDFTFVSGRPTIESFYPAEAAFRPGNWKCYTVFNNADVGATIDSVFLSSSTTDPEGGTGAEFMLDAQSTCFHL